MANPYFRFKQFAVKHDRCAMKVGTDGVLIGAWANLHNIQTAQVLDIGAGSGLVSLMLAQRFPQATIHSIEIDSDATNQANDNYNQSPFVNLSPCKCISLQNFAEETTQRFDFIVSNPPFFSHSLKSPQAERTQARHTDSLLVEELIELSAGLLHHPKGILSLIFPSSETDNLIAIASRNKLFPIRITNVYPTLTSTSKRVLISFSFSATIPIADNLVIEIARHQYSPSFTNLLKDFYLKM